jgi:hypothetical protein
MGSIFSTSLRSSHVPTFLPFASTDRIHIVARQFTTTLADGSVMDTWRFQTRINFFPIDIGRDIAVHRQAVDACDPVRQPRVEGRIVGVTACDMTWVAFKVQDMRTQTQSLLLVPHALTGLGRFRHTFYLIISAWSPPPLAFLLPLDNVHASLTIPAPELRDTTADTGDTGEGEDSAEKDEH